MQSCHCIKRCSHLRGLELYTKVSSFQGVGIVYRGVSSFQGVGIEEFHRIQRRCQR